MFLEIHRVFHLQKMVCDPALLLERMDLLRNVHTVIIV